MSIFREFLRRGYATAQLTSPGEEALSILYETASRYFSMPSETKSANRSADPNTGYRPLGVEYSQTAERPDLNESFALWARNRATIPGQENIAAFLDALEAYNDAVALIAASALEEIAAYYGRPAPGFAPSSYLQLNRYKPASAARDLLQDAHEDGHMFTIHHANAPGLQVELEGGFADLASSPGEVVILPASILTLMTGGLVDPLFHRVMRSDAVERISVLYFVNPDLNAQVPCFIENDFNRGIDIRERIVKNPNQFGLPDAKAYD